MPSYLGQSYACDNLAELLTTAVNMESQHPCSCEKELLLLAMTFIHHTSCFRTDMHLAFMQGEIAHQFFAAM